MDKRAFNKGIFAAVCAAAFSLASLVCGCSLNKRGTIIVSDPKQDSTAVAELSFFGYRADTLNLLVIEQTLHGFMNVNQDINVIYEGAKNDNYWSAFDRRNAADALDDLFMVDHDHVVEMSAEGKLLNLADILEGVDFQPKVVEQITDADGSIYFVPMNISSFNLFVNYGVLEKYGQSVPENYAQFAAVCDYFVSQGIKPLIVNRTASLRVLMAAKSMYGIYKQEDTLPAIQNFNANPEALAAQYGDGMDMVA